MDRKVILYGEMAEQFGREFTFNIRTPAEAIRALAATVPGFKDYLYTKNCGIGFVCGTTVLRDRQELDLEFGDTELCLVPRVRGQGGAVRALIGVALIAIDAFIYEGDGGMLTAVGWSLVIGGVSQVIFQSLMNDGQGKNTTEGNSNYAFNGPINTTRQGNPVPVGYGRVLCGSQVISVGLFV